MAEPTIHNILLESFQSADKAEWLRMASQELGEKNSLEILTWQVDGINFYPYYEKSDVEGLSYLKRNYPLSSSTLSETSGWQNIPRIVVITEKEANEKALQYLTLGADGIMFDVTGREEFDIHLLLDKLQWPFCAICFISSDTKIATKILGYTQEKNYDLSELSGSIFWKLEKTAALAQSALLPLLTKYHSLGIIVASSTPVTEISESLQQAVQLMDVMTDMGITKEIIFRSISLSFTCEENIFLTIAKLRAVRLLWYQISQAFKITNYRPAELYINIRSEKWGSEKFQPHGNMIKNTAHALAAVLGGCNGLTLSPEEEENEMMNRIALNISNILKEESHLDKVADPIAGSYALEKLTQELSEAAWQDFKNNLTL